MTEKRYFLHKHFLRNDVIHDKICHKWLKGEELERDMNILYNKYSILKNENEQLKDKLNSTNDEINHFTYLNASKNKYIGSFFHNGTPLTNNEVSDLLNSLNNENEQLKQQLKTCLEHYKCILDETVICNQCQECSKLSADYTADIMRGI